MSYKSGGSSVGVGISSILMIFVALCLTIFAVLSFLSARADYKLAKMTADAATAYYEADTKAERIYGALASASGDELQKAAEQSGASLSPSPDGTRVSYDVAVDERRTLHVELLLTKEGLVRTVWKVSVKTQETESGLDVLRDFSFLG